MHNTAMQPAGSPTVTGQRRADWRGMSFGAPLPASLLNIQDKTRSNLFPWRGQFSPQLVEALLHAYADKQACVLDPFMGSGTVLIECARLGMATFGCEVNPAAYLLAKVYELCTVPVSERKRVLQEASEILRRAVPSAFELPLFRPLPGEEGVPSRAGSLAGATADSRVQALLDALVVLADGATTCGDTLVGKWATIRSIVGGLPVSDRGVSATLGDARSLPLADASVDFVLTSPPYINVFNYHHNLRCGVEALGWEPLVVARSEIGSNRKFRQNRFLTVVQYCIDMALVLAELRRVCRRHAKLILILGRESNVHKTAFYNGLILERLAAEVAGYSVELKQERVFVNKFGQRIYEDILHLSPLVGFPERREVVIDSARRIGQQTLLAAVERVPAERASILDEAILRSQQVDPSPIFPCAATSGASV